MALPLFNLGGCVRGRVEVKAGATVNYDDLGGLQRLRDKLGDRFKCGVVLYTGERTLPFGDRIWVVPLAALWGSRGAGGV